MSQCYSFRQSNEDVQKHLEDSRKLSLDYYKVHTEYFASFLADINVCP